MFVQLPPSFLMWRHYRRRVAAATTPNHREAKKAGSPVNRRSEPYFEESSGKSKLPGNPARLKLCLQLLERLELNRVYPFLPGRLRKGANIVREKAFLSPAAGAGNRFPVNRRGRLHRPNPVG